MVKCIIDRANANQNVKLGVDPIKMGKKMAERFFDVYTKSEVNVDLLQDAKVSVMNDARRKGQKGNKYMNALVEHLSTFDQSMASAKNQHKVFKSSEKSGKSFQSIIGSKKIDQMLQSYASTFYRSILNKVLKDNVVFSIALSDDMMLEKAMPYIVNGKYDADVDIEQQDSDRTVALIWACIYVLNMLGMRHELNDSIFNSMVGQKVRNAYVSTKTSTGNTAGHGFTLFFNIIKTAITMDCYFDMSRMVSVLIKGDDSHISAKVPIKSLMRRDDEMLKNGSVKYKLKINVPDEDTVQLTEFCHTLIYRKGSELIMVPDIVYRVAKMYGQHYAVTGDKRLSDKLIEYQTGMQDLYLKRLALGSQTSSEHILQANYLKYAGARSGNDLQEVREAIVEIRNAFYAFLKQDMVELAKRSGLSNIYSRITEKNSLTIIGHFDSLSDSAKSQWRIACSNRNFKKNFNLVDLGSPNLKYRMTGKIMTYCCNDEQLENIAMYSEKVYITLKHARNIGFGNLNESAMKRYMCKIYRTKNLVLYSHNYKMHTYGSGKTDVSRKQLITGNVITANDDVFLKDKYNYNSNGSEMGVIDLRPQV
jgi:hypothetical protein